MCLYFMCLYYQKMNFKEKERSGTEKTYQTNYQLTEKTMYNAKNMI